MDILVIIWIVVFIGGRILTSVARKEQRKRNQQTTLSNDELEYRQTTVASQPVNAKPQQRNTGVQQNRNQSARMRQEMAQRQKNQTDHGQKAGSVKDYIERKSSSQKNSPLIKRTKQSFNPPAQQQMSMGYDAHEEIDWDNYEADFMASSEWDEGEEDIMLGVSELVALERQTTPDSAVPEQAVSQLYRPDTMKRAIIVSEILAKPKSLRKP